MEVRTCALPTIVKGRGDAFYVLYTIEGDPVGIAGPFENEEDAEAAAERACT